MVGPASRLFTRAAIWALDRFYTVSRTGPAIPDGPALIVSNHPNSVIDGLVVMKIGNRRVRPLARAPLFQRPVMGLLLRGLGALPVYRRQDDPSQSWRNRDTFGAAVESLGRGEAILIFPEGLSHSEPRLAPLKTGAARIALHAESAADWSMDLHVVPVGLTYDRKHAFRGRVAAAVGRPFTVSRWRARWEEDEWGAVESLTDAVAESLESVTLNVQTDDDRELVKTAESLYVIGKGRARPRQRTPLADRVVRLRRFGEAVTWLRTADPERYDRLAGAVRTYRRRLAILGAREGGVPRRYRAAAVLRYAAAHGAFLLIALPLAAVGALCWLVPYRASGVTLKWYRPAYELVATVKLATALVMFPPFYALWLLLGWWLAGSTGLVALAVGAPIAGVVALHWRDRWKVVREDVRLFWRAARRRGLRDQLADRRRALVTEFDELAREWRRSRRRRHGRSAQGGVVP